jgi:hypothetical protein
MTSDQQLALHGLRRVRHDEQLRGYTVIDPVGFAGTLPTAYITPPAPNELTLVILTSPYTRL